MNKKFLSVFTVLIASVSIVQAQVAEQIDSVYIAYGRPILITISILFIIYGGIANMNDIRAGGEQAKRAIGSFLFLVIWPIIILGIAEIASNFIN